jgi:hypothetical protein
MATTYYVDPAATGAGTGLNWTDAWVSIQSAMAAPVTVDDTVLCRGTQVLTTAMIPGVSGTVGNYIKYVGVNAAGVNDGTTFKLNGNSAAANCINQSTGRDYLYFENIEVYGATGVGWSWGTGISGYNIFKKCISRNCGSHGFSAGTAYLYGALFDRCKGYSNTGAGFSGVVRNGTPSNIFIGCSAYLNGASGFVNSFSCEYICCMSYTNTARGFYITGIGTVLKNCIAYGNTGANGHGIDLAAAVHFFVYKCKSCGNAQYGINGIANTMYSGGGNLCVNNSAGQINALIDIILAVEVDTITGGDGMISSATGNFMEATPVIAKYIAFALDAINNCYHVTGLNPLPDIPAKANVLPPETTDGEIGTSDKIYSAAEEQTRNTGAAVGIIKLAETIKQRNVDYVGTLANTPMPAPDAPFDLNAIATGTTSILITWTRPELSQGEKLERSTSPTTGFVEIADITADETADFVDTNRTENTPYYYQVKAYNDTGNSAYSEIESCTTFAVAAIPASTRITDLSQAIRNAILEITGFESENVIIGEITDFLPVLL